VHFDWIKLLMTPTTAPLIHTNMHVRLFVYTKGAFVGVINEQFSKRQSSTPIQNNMIFVKQAERKTRSEILLCYRIWGSVVWYICTDISTWPAASIIKADELIIYPDDGGSSSSETYRTTRRHMPEDSFRTAMRTSNFARRKRLEMD
jgi:hypothetical protein